MAPVRKTVLVWYVHPQRGNAPDCSGEIHTGVLQILTMSRGRAFLVTDTGCRYVRGAERIQVLGQDEGDEGS